MAMLQWVIFNYLIGNADAHAKNLSMLFTDKGPRLAPFYDLISTHVYETLAERFAMKIGGENRPNYIYARHWERLAESVSLKRNYVLSTVRNMADRVSSAAESVEKDFDKNSETTIISKIIELLRKRTAKLMSTKEKGNL